jgi:WD40 repeat protein
LDACRDNPYNDFPWLSNSNKNKDLREITPQKNVIISYATLAGKKAYPGKDEEHGIYTKYLLKIIQNTFGLKIEDIFKRVSYLIEKEKDTQVPCITTSLNVDFCFDNLYSKEVESRFDEVFSIDICEDFLASTGFKYKNNNYITLYKTNPFEYFYTEVRDTQDEWFGQCITFSSDEKIAVACSDGIIRLWRPDDETGKPIIHLLKGHSKSVFSICFSPDGNLLASAGRGGEIKLWDVQEESLIRFYEEEYGEYEEEHEKDVYCVTFSPDGKLLATASYTGIALWDLCELSTSNPIYKINENVCYVVAFSPDGQRLASGGEKNLKLWERDAANTWKLNFLLKENTTSNTNALKFSPNGEVLASGDYTVSLWDVSTGVLLQTFDESKQSDDIFYSIAYSSDGKMIFAGYNNSKIKRWCKGE